MINFACVLGVDNYHVQLSMFWRCQILTISIPSKADAIYVSRVARLRLGIPSFGTGDSAKLIEVVTVEGNRIWQRINSLSFVVPQAFFILLIRTSMNILLSMINHHRQSVD